MNADGSSQKQLTTEAVVGIPAWSVPLDDAPDGKIAFVRGGKVWTMFANGSGEMELQYTCPTDNGGICDNAVGNPTFSPSGSEIAAEYYGDIFVMPSIGGTSRVLLPGASDADKRYPGSELDPTWSPDGKKIAFEHNDIGGSGQYGIYMANANGSSTQAIQLTNNTGEIDPDWQPIPQCTVLGTAGDDTGANAINGTAGDDVICGLGGNDTIRGLGGNDILRGDAGNDKLVGGSGNDTLNGGPNKDTALYAGSTRVVASLETEFARGVGMDVLLGMENLSGSNANDILTGSASTVNALSGLGGNDTLNVRDGVANDKANGGPGTDTCKRDAGDKVTGCE